MRRARTSGAGFCAGDEARILAVRAKPTIGGNDGSAQTTGVLLKPSAVRPPITCSSALQMVGVSCLRRMASVAAVMDISGRQLQAVADEVGTVAQRLQLEPDDIGIDRA